MKEAFVNGRIDAADTVLFGSPTDDARRRLHALTPHLR
jgi:hypothetical protein